MSIGISTELVGFSFYFIPLCHSIKLQISSFVWINAAIYSAFVSIRKIGYCFNETKTQTEALCICARLCAVFVKCQSAWAVYVCCTPHTHWNSDDVLFSSHFRHFSVVIVVVATSNGLILMCEGLTINIIWRFGSRFYSSVSDSRFACNSQPIENAGSV